jgi:hypothetical protein
VRKSAVVPTRDISLAAEMWICSSRMCLRAKIRRKDGKEHGIFSIVENRRVSGGRVVQRHVLYLGEINDSQALGWRKSIEAFEDGAARPRTLALFPEDRCCSTTVRSSG